MKSQNKYQTKYQAKIRSLYQKKLGKSIKKELEKRGIKKNQVGEMRSAEDVELLSESSVYKILRGEINLTADSLYAFLSTFGYRNPVQLFFPNYDFCLELISEICLLIVTDTVFDKTLLKNRLIECLDTSYSQFKNACKLQIDEFVKDNSILLLDSIRNFFGECLDEDTSEKISYNLTEWLSELACFFIS